MAITLGKKNLYLLKVNTLFVTILLQHKIMVSEYLIIRKIVGLNLVVHLRILPLEKCMYALNTCSTVLLKLRAR